MKSLSRPVRFLISAVLFAACYIPINLLWMQVLPGYSRLVAGAAETFINVIEFSDTTYRISIEGGDYMLVARVMTTDRNGRKNVSTLNGSRKTDQVSYNITLWAALALATMAFLDRRARWKFMLIGPLVIFLWHICDLTIFAKNTRWILIKDINRQAPELIGYSYSWHWIWSWARELNRRIVDPFLPLLLWIIFCARSFLHIRQRT